MPSFVDIYDVHTKNNSMLVIFPSMKLNISTDIWKNHLLNCLDCCQNLGREASWGSLRV